MRAETTPSPHHTRLRVLDLFSGVGGFSLGLERTGGFETVAFCEIDPFCRKVLAKHWPNIPCHEDVTKLRGEDVGPVDVITGGFPCQDLSVAGKGAGLGGKQSGLWREFARLVGEIRPDYVLVENVAALLGRGLGRVLGDLATLGYDAEWHCIPATYVGAPHNRDRVWIVAYPERHEQPREEPRLGAIGRVGRVEQPVPWDEPWESALSRLRGMDDGAARSVDRTDAIRNAVVPQIPELIGNAILAAERHHTRRQNPGASAGRATGEPRPGRGALPACVRADQFPPPAVSQGRSQPASAAGNCEASASPFYAAAPRGNEALVGSSLDQPMQQADGLRFLPDWPGPSGSGPFHGRR